MRDRITLRSINGEREDVTVREYSVRESGLVLRRYEGGEGVYATPFYATVTTESAKDLRDFLLERYPLTDEDGDGFEPRTVQDRDGDVWIEVKPGAFKMPGICATRSLDEIESRYGIDDEPAPFEPRTIVDQDGDVWVEFAPNGFRLVDFTGAPVGDEPRSLDYVDETYGIDAGEPPAPTFEVGQRVRITGDNGSQHGLRAYTRAEIVDVMGSGACATLVIEDDGTNTETFRFDGVGYRYVSADEVSALSAVDAAETAKGYLSAPEPKIRFMTNTRSTAGNAMPAWEGTRVEVLEETRNAYSLRAVDGRPDGYGSASTFMWGKDGVDLVDEEPLAEWERELLEAMEEPAPKFAPGDRVRIVGGPYVGDASAPGGTGTVTGVDGDGRFRVATDDRDGYSGQNLGYLESEIEPFAQDAGDPTGSIVFVTGDSEEWGHGFEPGTAVRIVESDYDLDGSYEVRGVKDRDDRLEYVGAGDLDVVSPRVQEIPTGARVKVVNDGSEEGLRHWLEVGTFADVKGWTDTSTENSPFSETYEVVGIADASGPGVGNAITQSVAPGSIEVFVTARDGFRVGDRVRHRTGDEGVIVDFDHPDGSTVAYDDGATLGAATRNLTKIEAPLEPVFPSRFILGADPAVVEWGEVMKRSAEAMAEATRPAMIQVPSIGVEFGTFEAEPAPAFEVGTRVRLIDEGGDSSSPAKVGALGTVESVSGWGGETRLLRVRMDDGHLTGRRVERWEVAGAETDPRYCAICRTSPCTWG